MDQIKIILKKYGRREEASLISQVTCAVSHNFSTARVTVGELGSWLNMFLANWYKNGRMVAVYVI